MSNKKFFTYASLLALIAGPTVIEEVTAQSSAQHVYADELRLSPSTDSSPAEKTSEDHRPAAQSVSVAEPVEALAIADKESALNTAVLADANGSKPISEVRASQQGQPYTVTGKIISAVNGWGGNGFYIQDSQGSGLYIYPGSALGYVTGDVVQLTGTLTNYKGELQLKDVTDHKKLEGDLPTPVAEVTIPGLEKAHPSTLVKLSNVIVGDISSDKHETSSFKVTDTAGNSVAVRLDNRTGVKTSDLLSKIGKGDVINLTAIHSTFDGKLQLKPFNLDQFEVVKKAVREEEITPRGQVVKIGRIQGASHTSPLLNQAVTVKEVVVTYLDDATHFYVQDINGDNDKATSDGIRVFAQNAQVQAGDVLTISGTVEEFFGKGYDDRKQTDLTITQIKASKVTKTGTAQVPAPLVLGKDRVAPANIIDNDGFSVFDPEEDAIDFWESLEGMLVAVDNAKILGPMSHKEIYVLPGSSTRMLTNSGGILLPETGYNTDLIPVLFKYGKQTIKAGDSYQGRLAGPVSYSYGNYKVFVDDSSHMPVLTDGQLKPEKTQIKKDPSKLSIASYNIENFSANPSSTKDEKVKRIAESFIHDLNAPDIIGLIEVQDNNGPTDDGTTDARQSAQRLIDAIKALGGPTYQYVDIAPENNADGGQPGSNIRTGFLYQPERVSLSDKPRGGVNDAVKWVNGELSLSVGRIDPTNPAWKSVRKSLAAEFIFQGHKVVVVANHLNSKRGDNSLYGRVQPVTFKSEERRHVLARLLSQFTKEGASQQANIVMLGDFNDYEFTKTIKLIEEGDMANLVSRHELSDRYSYFYRGNNQTLDNMLVSRNLLGRYEFDMVHVNSPFMEAHGRASDHDPLLLQLSFGKDKPSAPSAQPKKTPAPAATTQASKAGRAQLLPKTGDKTGLMVSILGLTAVFSSFSLFRKRHEGK
ncbi:TPA: endonuclease/exonuclease/phosphatase family protein [Streptococcus equi subsp. zooepidemicus]|uniref:endonuclease/exonuclease/phosphatase family protein n=1 Tax=Streptococcus equi TaxID=1336 RepID=UPI0005BADB7F|nr:endonuclease/exonuclease/phosphatase family protein [Streptococcus equi]KIS14887.1 endonuclease/exonuclease/phosphatase family surface anchored protein [Streptococcus equi subsp. zooepidemicus SzAM60]HEL0639989.1 endonuclease/exonuclease/phosphatase family protein [Streptococcus equi subsp. zooepidemicus]HEL1177824.1 endonuclease/exonuclease/phosphatase family protein [Streptococcus equi subsp. zooepidemicus]HEL1235782.1 endonuclease/exonuclease/phosphatase family protein [Streptococcus equi